MGRVLGEFENPINDCCERVTSRRLNKDFLSILASSQVCNRQVLKAQDYEKKQEMLEEKIRANRERLPV